MVYDRHYQALEYYSGEKPKQSIIPHEIPASSVAGIIKSLTQIVTKLAENGKVNDDLSNHIRQLSFHEKRLMPEFLLRLADFYNRVREYGARDSVLRVVDFLQSEFGVPVQMYETSMN